MESVITTIILGVFCFVSFVYFKKYQEMANSKKELECKVRNLKTKVQYLQNYKDDVSRTFKILDNELMMIKDNISKEQSTGNVEENMILDDNRVTLLTPNILSSLMTPEFMRDINQEPSSEESNTLNRFLTVYLQGTPEPDIHNNNNTNQTESNCVSDKE